MDMHLLLKSIGCFMLSYYYFYFFFNAIRWVKEKKSFNNGKCPSCGRTWIRYQGLDNDKFRYYDCICVGSNPSTGRYIIVSFSSIDKDFFKS